MGFTEKEGDETVTEQRIEELAQMIEEGIVRPDTALRFAYAQGKYDATVEAVRRLDRITTLTGIMKSSVRV